MDLLRSIELKDEIYAMLFHYLVKSSRSRASIPAKSGIRADTPAASLGWCDDAVAIGEAFIVGGERFELALESGQPIELPDGEAIVEEVHSDPALVAATLAVIFAGLEAKGVKVVGTVPATLPKPTFPDLSPEQWVHLVPLAFVITVVVMVAHISAAAAIVVGISAAVRTSAVATPSTT